MRGVHGKQRTDSRHMGAGGAGTLTAARRKQVDHQLEKNKNLRAFELALITPDN